MLAADSEVLLDGSDFQDYVFVSVCVWDRDISLVSGFDLTDTLVPGGGKQVASQRKTWLGWPGDIAIFISVNSNPETRDYLGPRRTDTNT